MDGTDGIRRSQVIRCLIIELAFLANISKLCQAQVYNPIFRSEELQPIIAPLGKMVEGDFFGGPSIAAISESQKAIYFFSPDSQDQLVLANVVSLPDTPVAIAKGKPIVIDTTGHLIGQLSRLAVLMRHHRVLLVSFDSDGRPVLSEETRTDPFSTDIEAGDLEADGKLDIVTFGKFSLGVSISSNLGGKFQVAHPAQGPLGGTPFSDLKLADFNGDLVPDIAALDWVNHKLMIFYGRGDGTFAQPVVLPLRAEPSTLSVADLNGNGYPDIVVGYARISKIDVYSGDGFGRFFLKQTIETDGPVSDFAVADFTGDGTMDIAALSRVTGEITILYYDPMTKTFKYGGAFGVGDKFDDIIPFYFQNHLRADLVASSPIEKSLKIFETPAILSTNQDVLLPVSAGSQFLAVSNNDTSNCLLVADKRGGINWETFDGSSPLNVTNAIRLKSKGTPSAVKVISRTESQFLFSYGNADVLSVYDFPGQKGQVRELRAGTEFPPFTINGGFRGDSLVLAAAYRVSPDNHVEIACFGKVAGQADFIEKDFSADEKDDYLTSWLTVNPTLSFLRVWKSGKDSLTYACTNLSKQKTVKLLLHGSDASFQDGTLPGFPILAVQGEDTLSIYQTTLIDSSMLLFKQVSSMPMGRTDFNSVSMASADSTSYLAYYNHTLGAAFLYYVLQDQPRFIRAWTMASRPTDIVISPSNREIYFLNEGESYVSLQYF